MHFPHIERSNRPSGGRRPWGSSPAAGRKPTCSGPRAAHLTRLGWRRKEREEIATISAYLPKQMSEADVKAAISAIIAETNAAGIKDMGRVIGALKAKYAGQMDFGKASGLVKAALTG